LAKAYLGNVNDARDVNDKKADWLKWALYGQVGGIVSVGLAVAIVLIDWAMRALA
jgi:hypothetical protein